MTIAAISTDRPVKVFRSGSTAEGLKKVRVVPPGETWLWHTPAALDSAMRGLGEARRGEIDDWGSFAQFADTGDDVTA